MEQAPYRTGFDHAPDEVFVALRTWKHHHFLQLPGIDCHLPASSLSSLGRAYDKLPRAWRNPVPISV
jgi:hypothetical protein